MLNAFEPFQIRGLALAHRLMYSRDLVNEAIAILRASFGEAWLSVVEDGSETVPLGLGKHPLRADLRTAGASQVVSVLELCHYLKALPAAASGTVVANLKDAFSRNFLQLAFAYRVLNAGARDVHLEPPAAGGRVGDIGFTWRGRPFIAECYSPTVAQAGDQRNEELRLAMDVMALLTQRVDDVVSVAIRLARPVVPEHRRAVVRAIRNSWTPPLRLFRLFRVEGTTVSIAPSRTAGPGEDSLLVVHPAFDTSGREDMFMRVAHSTREAAFSLIGDGPRASSTGSQVVMWLDPATRAGRSADGRPLGPELARLAKKTERKLRQTKRDAGTGRLVIVRSWIAEEFHNANEDSVAAFRRQLVDQHDMVAGVLLVRRSWSEEAARYRYKVHPVVALARAGADLCEELRNQEENLFVPPRSVAP